MNLLLLLTVHGSLAFLSVWGLDRMLGETMNRRGRRGWWLLVPLIFLVASPIPLHPSPIFPAAIPTAWKAMKETDTLTRHLTGNVVSEVERNTFHFVFWIWLAGALAVLVPAILQTWGAQRRWAALRFCTDSALLDVLEDGKAEAKITAPIGLVVSDDVPTVAIFGWLRPRILLPRTLAISLSREELRAVFFHELAHFRHKDILVNWLFILARAVHWFNPLVHLASWNWSRFREEAADEAALFWMREASGETYGRALLHAIRQTQGPALPYGALALGESFPTLTRRLRMIQYHQPRPPRLFLACSITILITTAFLLRPVAADEASDKAAMLRAVQDWLHEIDRGDYGQSWTDASGAFEKALASDRWVQALQAVRRPLGACSARTLASALHQTEVPSSSGTEKGDFYVVQYDTSFENLKYAVETITFMKEGDGTWKAAGYYIKPKP